MQVNIDMKVSKRPPPWMTLAVSSFSAFAVFLDALIALVAFPEITRAFRGANQSAVSWVLNAYTIVYASLLIPLGRYADLSGRKYMFLIGTALFTAASTASGLAPSVYWLIVFRITQAVGGALISSTGLALTIAAFPKERRVVAITIMSAVGALAVAIGPSLGAAIVEYSSWRWIFFLNIPVGVLSLLLGARILENSRDESIGAKIDWIGVLLLIASAALIAYSLIESGAKGWESTPVLVTLVAGIFLLILTAWETLSSKNPVIEVKLFRNRNFLFSNLALLIFGIGFTALFFNAVYFLTTVWHYSLLTMGLAITPGPVTVIALSPIAGKIANARGHRVLAVPGGLLFAAGPLFVMLTLRTLPDYLGVWLPYSIITGSGIALVLPVLTSAIARELPRENYSVGSGVAVASRQFGAVLGTSLALAFLGNLVGLSPFREVWWLMVVTGLLTSVLSMGLSMERTERKIEKAYIITEAGDP